MSKERWQELKEAPTSVREQAKPEDNADDDNQEDTAN